MASNPAMVQLWLVPVAVIPGLLAYGGLLSNNQAGICVIVLYLLSRWHTAKIQRRFEAKEAQARRQHHSEQPLDAPSTSSSQPRRSPSNKKH
eukprot:c1638_g1_i1 orf=111-386(+)